MGMLRQIRYIQYHDEEWGIPVHNDRKLFEMLILESFQAGLSWEYILNKRDAFRRAFDNFDLEKVCRYSGEKLEQLQQDSGIVRSRRKICAAVNNAGIFRAIQQEWGVLIATSGTGRTEKLSMGPSSFIPTCRRSKR